METIPPFDRPNVCVGADPFELATAAADASTDVIVLLFQRDHRRNHSP